AEDGIRDGHVTGVQTCALPICPLADRAWRRGDPWRPRPHLSERDGRLICPRIAAAPPRPEPRWPTRPGGHRGRHPAAGDVPTDRSEERRVGKGWRGRRGGYDLE